MRRLDSVDAQFLAIEDGRTHAHVCQLTIMEGKDADGTPVTAQTIHDLIAKRIHLMPPFRWRVKEVPFGLDYPVFIDDSQFDLDSHIWELALPAPGDAEQLGELVGRLASRPLDRSRPLWEAHVIGGLADGHVAMLTKLHHAAVDGISGIEMLSILLDDSPTGREIEAPAANRQRTNRAISNCSHARWRGCRASRYGWSARSPRRCGISTNSPACEPFPARSTSPELPIGRPGPPPATATEDISSAPRSRPTCLHQWADHRAPPVCLRITSARHRQDDQELDPRPHPQRRRRRIVCRRPPAAPRRTW